MVNRERISERIDAQAAAAILREAASLLLDDPTRKGNIVQFGGAGQLVVTGDMHGNLRNFDKLQRFCVLEQSPARSVLLHELIHAEIHGFEERDHSIDLLLEAAQWKCDFPDQVFMMQSNHELAQLLKQEITKGGRSVLADFAAGVEDRFGAGAPEILEAVDQYVAALPLAARTANGVIITHSLPDPMRLSPLNYDFSVFERRPLTAEDVAPGGPAYDLVWGRFHRPQEAQAFAAAMGARFCIVGHTPQESGYATIGPLIILASDHNHGCFLPIDLSREYSDVRALETGIRKFVSVA